MPAVKPTHSTQWYLPWVPRGYGSPRTPLLLILELHPGGDRAPPAQQGCSAQVGCWRGTRSPCSTQGTLPWEPQQLPWLGRGSRAQGSGRAVPFPLALRGHHVPASSSSVLRKPSPGSKFPFELVLRSLRVVCHCRKPYATAAGPGGTLCDRHSLGDRHSRATSSGWTGGRSLQSTSTLSSPLAGAAASTPACAPQLQLISRGRGTQRCSRSVLSPRG